MNSKNDEVQQGQQGEDRREFLLKAALAAAGVTATAIPLHASAESSGGGRVLLQKPITWKLLKSHTDKEGAVKDSTSLFELTGNNGARHVVDAYTKRIEHGGGHIDIAVLKTDHYASSSDQTPVHSETRTVIGTTKFGDLTDNVRKDEVTIEMIGGNGVKTFPRLIVKVPIPNPYSGLSDQELMDKILSEKLGAR